MADRKTNKIYQRKLKSGNRLWALEIILWKLRLYGKLRCIRQTLQLSKFYRVSLADLCVLLIDTFEKLPLINSERQTTTLTRSKTGFFVTLVNAVN